ncbi:MAG: isochorismatase [Deltaproteobacteria bacterium]|nr:MAG: isochorismatase [Deltaproteobacteria bacterium]
MKRPQKLLGSGRAMERFLLDSSRVCLHVVDVQTRLMAKMAERQTVIDSIALLVQSFGILDIPILGNSQYREKLGPYVAELEVLLQDIPCFDKISFDATKDPATIAYLQGLRPRLQTVVLVGVETHICVYQTALGLLQQGLSVWVVSDGVAARSKEDHRVALRRLQGLGVSVGSSEMLVYELLGRADTTAFKDILPYILERDTKKRERPSSVSL